MSKQLYIPVKAQFFYNTSQVGPEMVAYFPLPDAFVDVKEYDLEELRVAACGYPMQVVFKSRIYAEALVDVVVPAPPAGPDYSPSTTAPRTDWTER